MLSPFINLQLVSMIASLSDASLNRFIISHLLHHPATILSSLYLSASAGKAIINAVGDEDETLVVCGNPIVPTFLLNMFIWLTFILSILFNFECAEIRNSITIDKIARMDVPFKVKLEIYTYSLLGLLSLVIFALTEDEEQSTDFDRPLYRLFTMLFIVVLMVLLFAETWDKVGRQALVEGAGKAKVEVLGGGEGGGGAAPLRGEGGIERKGSHAELLFSGALGVIPT